MKIAIIVSCYNRRAITQKCLSQLHKQILQHAEHAFSFFVYDDASTDGTQEMIRTEFPHVRLLCGQGGLYWCKSMHHAMKEAVKEDYDLYLMINDDVDFNENAIQIMLQAYDRANKPCGIVGATKETASDKISYGGRDRNGNLIRPGKRLQRCIWANWNCFMIDREIIRKVGLIDGKYEHSWGDFDYSHRMLKEDYPIYLAEEYVGECDRNSIDGTFRDIRIGKRKQLKKLFLPKGMPFYSYMRYHLRVYGWTGCLKYLCDYLSLILYIIVGKKIEC